jgi:hypothetical protein
MKNYLKSILDKLLWKTSPERDLLIKKEFEDEAKELTALMDIIPNAKLIAEMYKGLIKAGALDPWNTKEDPTIVWLEMEEIVLHRCAIMRYYNQKIIFAVILFILVATASYVFGSYLLSKEIHHHMHITHV